MFFMPFYGRSLMWIVGGRSNDASGKKTVMYYNDIWVANMSGGSQHIDPVDWYPLFTYVRDFLRLPVSGPNSVIPPSIPWIARTGHTVTLLDASPGNRFGRTLFVIGGYTAKPTRPQVVLPDGSSPIVTSAIADGGDASSPVGPHSGSFLDDLW
jgi:hypothetical protein